jgi:hypothetical protein
MARVPITVMDYRRERCGHEWISRGGSEDEPRVCPKCRGPWWNRPRNSMMTHDDFHAKIVAVSEGVERPLTWTEIRSEHGTPARHDAHGGQFGGMLSAQAVCGVRKAGLTRLRSLTAGCNGEWLTRQEGSDYRPTLPGASASRDRGFLYCRRD